MKRSWSLFVIGLFTVGLAAGWAAHETPDIAEIMTKGHKRGGFRDVISKEIMKPSPNWETVQEKSKEFVTLAEALGENKPPKGSEADWKKQCEAYVKIVKDLEAAAQKKNKANANTALQRLGRTCKSCHDAHQDN